MQSRIADPAAALRAAAAIPSWYLPCLPGHCSLPLIGRVAVTLGGGCEAARSAVSVVGGQRCIPVPVPPMTLGAAPPKKSSPMALAELAGGATVSCQGPGAGMRRLPAAGRRQCMPLGVLSP